MLVRALPNESAPLLARPFFAGGDPGPITATMAHVPELLEVGLPFIGAALSPSAIPLREKEIVIVRTSANLRCRYCVDAHTGVALDSGLTHDQVRVLRHELQADIAEHFDRPRDQALLAWVDAVSTGRGPIDAPVNDVATSQFGEHELVELTLVITVTMLLNRYATSLQLTVDDATLARLAAAGFASSGSRS